MNHQSLMIALVTDTNDPDRLGRVLVTLPGGERLGKDPAPGFDPRIPHDLVHYLTEALVQQGHEVTLYASADSRTSARLRPTVPEALRLSKVRRDALPWHLLQLAEIAREAGEYDIVHFHTDLLHFPLSRKLEVPQLTTLHGRLSGHIAIGATMLATTLAAQPEPVCMPEEAMILEHFILSHHGKLEYGAAVKPMTLEAEILHFADDASAKTAAINEAYGSSELFPNDSKISSKRVWQLDNRWLLRSDVDFGRGESV